MRRRFFADEVEGAPAVITGPGAAHLVRVLRAEAGRQFELVFAGRLYLARIRSASPAAVHWDLERELAAPEPEPERILAAALFKFDRFEWMLEKSTELGVSRVLPLILQRCDPRLAPAAPKRLDRWRTIVKEAAQQSRRMAAPTLEAPIPWRKFLAAPPPGRRFILTEPPAGEVLLAQPEAVLLLTGPEGGFTDVERDAASASGFQSVSLGPRVLRCETAILAALACWSVALARAR